MLSSTIWPEQMLRGEAEGGPAAWCSEEAEVEFPGAAAGVAAAGAPRQVAEGAEEALGPAEEGAEAPRLQRL